MTFPDDDLKWLKEQCFAWQQEDEDSTYEVTVSPSNIEALLARLEAAEKAMEFDGHSGKCGWDIEGIRHCDCGNIESYEAWRKAAGKTK